MFGFFYVLRINQTRTHEEGLAKAKDNNTVVPVQALMPQLISRLHEDEVGSGTLSRPRPDHLRVPKRQTHAHRGVAAFAAGAPRGADCKVETVGTLDDFACLLCSSTVMTSSISLSIYMFSLIHVDIKLRSIM